MADSGIAALGRVVQQLRKAKNMTQQQLGEQAGYGIGAAVSISRFENGVLTPGPDKLRAIAEALGMSSEDLEQEASGEPTRADASTRERPKDRRQRVDRKVAERARELTSVSDAFAHAQESVGLRFLTPLSQTGARIEGARPVDVGQRRPGGHEWALGDTSKSTTDFSQAVAEGTAVGVALSFLRLARGLPIGGIAVPVIAAVAGAAVTGVMTVQRQQRERDRQTDRAEAELTATEANFVALTTLMPRATELLDYIALHAGHALERWDRALGTPAPPWLQLDDDAKARFLEFLSLSQAAIEVYAIRFEELATTPSGDELDEQVAALDEMLTRSQKLATSIV